MSFMVGTLDAVAGHRVLFQWLVVAMSVAL